MTDCHLVKTATSTVTARGDVAINQNRLDFLRGVAAVYVLLNHTRGSFWIGGQELLAKSPTLFNYATTLALQFTSLGKEFVILFFVLSGFAMRHSVKHSVSVRRFYLKRVLRIWPPYLVAILVAFVCSLVTDYVFTTTKLASMSFYMNVSTPLTPQFWSLPYEVLFYILCPVMLVTQRRVQAFSIMAGLFSVVTIITKGIILNPFDSMALNFLGNEMLFFACGALLYDNLSRLPTLSSFMLTIAGAALILLVWLAKHWAGDSNMLSSAAMILLTCLLVKCLPCSLADRRATNWGFFSYSIYIFHYAIIVIIGEAIRRVGVDPYKIENPLAWIVPVPVILLLCLALYWVSERWSNRLVAKLRSSPARHAVR